METKHPDVEKVLFTEEDIDAIVTRLGAQITRITRARILC